MLRRSVFGRTAAADMGEIAQTAHRQTNPRVFAGVYRGTRGFGGNLPDPASGVIFKNRGFSTFPLGDYP